VHLIKKLVVLNGKMEIGKMLKLLAYILLFLKFLSCKGDSNISEFSEKFEKCLPREDCPTLSWLPHSDLSSFQTCGKISLAKLSLESQFVNSLCIIYHPRFFDLVGHQTTIASIGNNYFFTK